MTQYISKPNLFIVGAPKCGTTSLSKYLRQRPEIFISTPKEPNYFNSDLISNNPRFSEAEYMNLFVNARGKKWIGEASSWYLYSKAAASQINNFNKKSKIIISIKNPTELLLSFYYQNVYNGSETNESFEKAILQSFSGINDSKNSGNNFAENLFYSEVPKYHDQIKRYIDCFGRENCHIIIFEDFVNNLEKELELVFNFLSISTKMGLPLDLKAHNKAKTRKSNLLAKKIDTPPLFIKKIATIIPSEVRSKIYSHLKNFNKKEIEKPSISSDFEKMITKKFRNEMVKTEELIGMDLSRWYK